MVHIIYQDNYLINVYDLVDDHFSVEQLQVGWFLPCILCILLNLSLVGGAYGDKDCYCNLENFHIKYIRVAN